MKKFILPLFSILGIAMPLLSNSIALQEAEYNPFANPSQTVNYREAAQLERQIHLSLA